MQKAIISWKGVIIHHRWQLACLLEGKGRVLVLSSARSAKGGNYKNGCIMCKQAILPGLFLTSNQLTFQ